MIGITRRNCTICVLTLGQLALSFSRLVAEDSLQLREERAMKAALAHVAPAVVRIETVGGLERVEKILIGTGPTTGLVVSPDGYIISSAFNFVQKPDSILITLEDGSRHAAKLVATDHSRMLVLMKIDAEATLAVPTLVPQSEMRVGWWALAVGRTFEPREPNLSVGIISALDRIWGRAIQTDAKISPQNYGGPLVDIAGRVLGVLVPMSPDSNGEVAGVEWYDSGIGFAIPLESILRVLPKLQQGHDLHPGLLGISMKSADLYSQPALIAAARATGPAYKAGFRAGDKIVEAAGQPVTRQAELKQQLGHLYAGDKIKIVALRGDQRLDRELELADKIEPYEFPFLGILPMRNVADDKASGLIVRYVYSDSPAAKVGIMPGDRIESVGGEAIRNAENLLEKLQSLAPEEKVKVELRRGDETLRVEPQLARLPSGLPGELPPAHASPAPPDGERPQVGLVTLKIPEFENQCVAYVPESYNPRLAYGVVVWLHAPGGFKQEELIERWKPLCERQDFILLAPKSLDPTRWQPTEARFVRRVLDEVVKTYTTDASRLVVHGHEGGGALAYLVGMANIDVMRAVAAVEAPLPRQVQPPETDPVHRLAVYTTQTEKGESTAAIEAGIKRMQEMKYPLAVKKLGDVGRYLTPEELAELVRWFDSLDRL